MGILEDRAKSYVNRETAEIVINLVNSGRDEDLYHINIYGIADKWGIERKDILAVFLEGVKYGIFSIQWVFHCPKCGNIVKEVGYLKDAVSICNCPLCIIDFNNKLDSNIEVFFSISEDIRNIPEFMKKEYVNTMLHDITNNGQYSWRQKETILGSDCLNNSVFLSLFPDDILQESQSLEIGKVTMLFADIKNSTALYERLGDARAFSLIKGYHKIIFDEIADQRGVTVKTMSDEIMGAFMIEADALKAAIEIQKKIIAFASSKSENEKIEMKIGLYSGSVIVVSLDGRLDYFGATVNMAAKIQEKALPNEVVLPGKMYESNLNKKVIKDYTDIIYRTRVFIKGVTNEVDVYKIKF